MKKMIVHVSFHSLWLLVLSFSSFGQSTIEIDSTLTNPPHNYDRAMTYFSDDKKHEALIVSIFMAKSENLDEVYHHSV